MEHVVRKDYSTKQRNIILEVLKEHSDEKLTADEIMNMLHKSNNIVSKATLYRNLDLLVSKGIVCKVLLDNLCSCYIYKSEENNTSINFCCDCCGMVVQIKSPLISRMNLRLEKEFDCLINQSKTIIHGTCNKCKGVSK